MDEARGSAERGDLREIIEAELLRLLPDHEVVDRDLVLLRGRVRGSKGRRADLVLQDAAGCALIVLIVDGRGDETVLAAVDALAYARDNVDALARPPRPPARREVAVRVALVAETFSNRTLVDLSVLPGRELILIEARKIESAAGTRTRLVRLEPLRARGSGTIRGGADENSEIFLATVPESLRGTAALLLRRLARVDAGIEFSFAEGAADIRCGERELCVLDVHEGVLHGEIDGHDHRLPIRGSDDADAFLDEVLRLHLRHLDPSWSVESPSASGVSRARSAGEPLLTAEEIAAFQE
jgi:hypothetical protein